MELLKCTCENCTLRYEEALKQWAFFLHYLIVTEPEPECEFPETMGDDYSDNDMPDMGEVSEHCLGNMAVMLTCKMFS